MRYDRIRKKLGVDPAYPGTLNAGIPDRPKGMYQETYEELPNDLHRTADRYHEQAYLVPMGKYTGAPAGATEDDMLPLRTK